MIIKWSLHLEYMERRDVKRFLFLVTTAASCELLSATSLYMKLFELIILFALSRPRLPFRTPRAVVNV